MPVHIVVLGEKKYQPYCMALPTREMTTMPPEAIEDAFMQAYGDKMAQADLVLVWLPNVLSTQNGSAIPEHLQKSIFLARSQKKRVVFCYSDKVEEDVAFWNKPLPHLFRCKSCGRYALMTKVEPWAGHNCKTEIVQPTIDEPFRHLGEWLPVAHGSMARILWVDLQEKNKVYA